MQCRLAWLLWRQALFCPHRGAVAKKRWGFPFPSKPDSFVDKRRLFCFLISCSDSNFPIPWLIFIFTFFPRSVHLPKPNRILQDLIETRPKALHIIRFIIPRTEVNTGLLRRLIGVGSGPAVLLGESCFLRVTERVKAVDHIFQVTQIQI